MIKILVGRNIKVLSKTELNHVQLKYEEIVNSSEISNSDEIYDVWNQLYDGTGPKKTQKIGQNFAQWWRQKDHGIKGVIKWKETWLSITPTKI